MKKEISKKGYRTLAVIWTLAAASMAVAFVRYLPVEFNLFLLLMTALSMLTASNFWRTYRRTPEKYSIPNPFDTPPKFADNPELFDDAPPLPGSGPSTDDVPSPAHSPNQDSEEKNHE